MGLKRNFGGERNYLITINDILQNLIQSMPYM